jgi:hypothetical protein
VSDGNGNSSGLAGLGLDPRAVWGFGLLSFRIHATHPFMERRKVAGKDPSILARPAVPVRVLANYRVLTLRIR